MNQQRNNSKNGVLRIVAIALMALMLVAAFAVTASADVTTITLDSTKLVFPAGSGISVGTDGVITKTYDATTAITGVTVNPSVLPNGKDVTITVTAAWTSADAGSSSVSVNYVLGGTDASDYTLNTYSAVYSGKILPVALNFAAGTATVATDYVAGQTAYAFTDADVANKPALDKTGLTGNVLTAANALTYTVNAFTVNKSAAGTYPAEASVTLSDSNFTVGSLAVSATINKLTVTNLVWNNVTGITYGDPKNASVTAYVGTVAQTGNLYNIAYPANYGDAGNYTLTATLLDTANYEEAAGLTKTKDITVAPKTYAVTMSDQSVAGDGKTPYTIGVEGADLPSEVKGKIAYTVNGTPFTGTSVAGAYVIKAALPGGNYAFTSGGSAVTELSATLTVTVDQLPVPVWDGDKVASTVILTAKNGLPAGVTASAVKAVDVKLPKGAKYAQAFQLQLAGASENDTFTVIVPLSYEVYSKGCKALSESSLYIYDAAGKPVAATSKGYTVTVGDGYFKIDGVKGTLGTLTFAIAPQYSNGGIPMPWLLIIILILVVALLVAMFFIGRAIRKRLIEEETEETVQEPEEVPAEEPAEEETTEEDVDLDALAEETAEELAETPAEEEEAPAAEEEAVEEAVEEAQDDLNGELAEEAAEETVAEELAEEKAEELAETEAAPEAEENADGIIVAAAVADAMAENTEEEAAEEAPAEEPAVETISVVEDETVAVVGIPDYLKTKSGGLLYVDTKQKPDLYQEMLDLEAAGQAQVLYRYRKSYRSKLSQADEKIREYYVGLKSAMLYYRGVRARKSWNYEAYNRGRNPIAKLIPKSKTIYLYLAIDPAELADTKYGVVDVSEKKKFAATPSLMKIKGDRKYKFALELIEKICAEQLELKPRRKQVEPDTIGYMSSEELLEAGLVKQLAAAAPLDSPVEVYGKAPAEEPVAEAPVEETPVEETPVEETPVEEAIPASAEAEEAPVEAPAEEATEEAPVEETPAEEAPAEEAPAEEEKTEPTDAE